MRYHRHRDQLAKHPSNWWLRHHSTQYLLAVLVHQKSPDLYKRPEEVPTGNSHAKIHAGATVRTQDKRATARDKDTRLEACLRMENKADCETNQEFKRARVPATEQHTIQQQTNSVATQIRLFNKNCIAFIAVHNEKTYMNAIVELLTSFAQPSHRVVDGKGTSSVAQGGDSSEGSLSDGKY